MGSFVFVYYLDDYRLRYLKQLQTHLHSLRLKGGRAAGYPRFLMYSGAVSGPEGGPIREFARREGVELVPVPRPFSAPKYNKLMMYRVPEGDVTCLIDLDTLILRDPTPAFEQAREQACFMAALPPRSPVRRFTGRARLAALNTAFDALGRRVWLSWYRRYSPGRPAPSLVRCLERKPIYPYFNSGVIFTPRRYLSEIEEVCMRVTADLEKCQRRPSLTRRVLQLAHINQITLGIAVHACGIPWKPLSHLYNFVPDCARLPQLRAALEGGEVAIAHLVRQHTYLEEQGFRGELPEHLRLFVAAIRPLLVRAASESAGAPG